MPPQPPQQPPPGLFRAPLAPHPVATSVKRVSQCVLERAAKSTRRLIDGPLLSRLETHAYLPVFSAFLARRETAPATSGRKRRGNECRVLSTTLECAGVVYGCCLGALVAYLKLAKVSTSYTVRQIEAVLSPVAVAALKTRGIDSRLLCAGIASSRVIRAQLALAATNIVPTSLHSRNGNPSTVIGMCASIFVIFSLLSSTMLGSVESKQVEKDIQWMLEHNTVDQVLSVADSIASSAVPTDGWACAPQYEVDALDAEHRAIQRARRGVVAARAFCERHRLAPIGAFRKVLEWFARAAWPPGELLNERTHDDVLRRLRSEHYYMQAPKAADPAEPSPSDLVPLAQLSGLAERSSRSHTDSDASSVATGSSARTVSSGACSSRAASVAGDLGPDMGDTGIEHLFEVQLVHNGT